MREKLTFIAVIFTALFMISACGAENESVEENVEEHDLTALEVDFEVPETAEVGETIELKATVTYGEETVEDADEVLFEVWLEDEQDDSIEVEGVHQGDGVYTAETTLEEAGTYSMYAHTTARAQHTMPLETVEVE